MRLQLKFGLINYCWLASDVLAATLVGKNNSFSLHWQILRKKKVFIDLEHGHLVTWVNKPIINFSSSFTCFQEAVRMAQPLFLFYLVSYFIPGSSVTRLAAYLNAMGITLVSMLSVILHQLYFFHGHRTGMHLRIASTGCVYRKASLCSVVLHIYAHS